MPGRETGNCFLKFHLNLRLRDLFRNDQNSRDCTHTLRIVRKWPASANGSPARLSRMIHPAARRLLLSYRKSVQRSDGSADRSSPRCNEEKKASVARERVSADRPMQCRNCIDVLDRVARSDSVPFFAAFLVGL